MKNLVIVAGHAIYTASGYEDPGADPSWQLFPYQYGEGPSYIEHIRRGVELTAADPEALLVFSGGPTRLTSGPRTEAGSYWLLAEHFGWWGTPAPAITEEFARDSFENLLYGICRFHEFAGGWPERLTFVSWEFKRARFELYCKALRWPLERFRFEGPNQTKDLAGAMEGERRNILEPWAEDPYLQSAQAVRKKGERNPWKRTAGYEASCPEVRELLRWKGPALFEGPLPW